MNSLLEQQEELDAIQSVIRTLGLRHTFPLVAGFKRPFKNTVKVKKHSLIGHAPSLMTYYKDWSTLSSSNIRAPFLYTLLRAKGLRVPLLEHTHDPMTSPRLPLEKLFLENFHSKTHKFTKATVVRISCSLGILRLLRTIFVSVSPFFCSCC